MREIAYVFSKPFSFPTFTIKASESISKVKSEKLPCLMTGNLLLSTYNVISEMFGPTHEKAFLPVSSQVTFIMFKGT